MRGHFYEQFEKPFLCLFTADDPVTLGADKPFIAKVPGAAGLNHQVFERGGHFLQERCHHELSRGNHRPGSSHLAQTGSLCEGSRRLTGRSSITTLWRDLQTPPQLMIVTPRSGSSPLMSE